MILIVMGVSGSGKTHIGQQLAKELGWVFYEGDAFHPQANIDKMSRGEPLNDEDRAPWLAALRDGIDATMQAGRSAVFSCSALKEKYRDVLNDDHPDVRVVYLDGDFETIYERMKDREDHFMKADMLRSQFEALEEPKDAVRVDIEQEPAAIVANIRTQLGL